MPEGFSVGDAYIDLRLKQDKLQADSAKTTQALRDQQTSLQGVADKAEQAGQKSNVALGGMVGLALKAVTVMGSVELALGAVNIAADLLGGNIEDAAAGIERLPAGIGPVARQLKDLLGTITGIKEQTEAWQRATENLEAANQRRFETSINALRAEEAALLNRLKIEQQIQLLGTADGDEAARLKARFDATNRLAEAENAIAEARRKAAEFALSGAGEASELQDRRRAAENRLKELRDELSTAEKRRGAGDTVGKFRLEAENLREKIAAYEVELNSIKALQTERQRQIDSYQDEARRLEELIPLLKDLSEAEQRALEQSIEKRKTEEQKREAQERIRDAERETEEKKRLAEQEFRERERLAQEAHDNEMRLMRERADEAARALRRQLDISRNITELESSLRRKKLLAEGRDLQAEIDQIAEEARRRVQQAQSERERELILQNRDQDIQDAIRNAEASLSGASPTAGISGLEAAISNLQSAALSREDPAIAQRREQIEIAKRQAEKLRDIEQNTKTPPNQPPAVGE